jgi:iron complex transport system substrate-binding protein
MRLCAAIMAVAFAVSTANAAPTRIASLHLCADQLVLALADRAQIASLTFLAAEPLASVMAEAARGIPANHGKAEEIVALKPDLVLAGPFSARATTGMLRRLGLRVVDLPLAAGFDDIRAQIRLVADAVGHPARGQDLVARLDALLDEAAAPADAPRPTAALYQPGGFTARLGSLEHAVIAAAGFDNLATRLPATGSGRVALETLVAAAPDLLILGGESDHLPAAQVRLLAHPALRALPSAMIRIPPRLWTCGGWFTADAVEQLAVARRALAP